MPRYAYKAHGKKGELVSGTTEGKNKLEIINALDGRGYSITELKIEEGGVEKGSIFDYFGRIKKKDIVIFKRQLSTLLHSGTPLIQSLNTILEQSANKKFRLLLEDVIHSLRSGLSLSDALAKHPKVFSELFVSMVRVGETGGILDKVLFQVAKLDTQQMGQQSRIRSALVYPIVLVIVAFLVVNLLVIGVLPKFASVFRASGAKLPAITRIVLTVSWILRKDWYFILLGLIIIIWWIKSYIGTEEGKLKFHRNLLKIPVFGNIYTTLQVSRFTRTLSAITSIGIPLLQAMDVVKKTVTNLAIRQSIENIRNHLSEGRSLAEPFKSSGYFSPLVVQMIATGEKTGKLDEMLNEIASFYEPELESTIKNLTSLLEPIMLLIMGAVVAFIALSVLLPIFNLVHIFRG